MKESMAALSRTEGGREAGAAVDIALVKAMARGDETALGRLYDRHANLLMGLAVRILGDHEDAEEVVQEAFVHAWRHAGSYDAGRSAVSTWLVMVTRSRAIDRLRSGRSVERTLQTLESRSAVADTSSNDVSAVLSVERRQRIRAELDRLPPEQKQVLEMAFFAGLTQTEIAAAAGLPLGTVKTRTLLAMKKLRVALAAEARDLL